MSIAKSVLKISVHQEYSAGKNTSPLITIGRFLLVKQELDFSFSTHKYSIC